MMRINPGRLQQCLLFLTVSIFLMLVSSCADDEDALRPKVNKYDLFKDNHATGTTGGGLLSEAAAMEKSTLVVKVNHLVLVDSNLKRGGAQYLYSAGEVAAIIKTATRDSVLSDLMFISHTRLDVRVTVGSPMTLFLDSIATESPLRTGGVKYKWLNNAPLK